MKCFKIETRAIGEISFERGMVPGCGVQHLPQGALAAACRSLRSWLCLDKPVDLGSRCTVFMNSSVKAGPERRRVHRENFSRACHQRGEKRACKVIRASGPEELAARSWCRAVFSGITCTARSRWKWAWRSSGRISRPDGRFWRHCTARQRKEPIVSAYAGGLEGFTRRCAASTAACAEKNNCQLTVNIFSGRQKYISGNRCDRQCPTGARKTH